MEEITLGIVGCGFASYLYGGTLQNYPWLRPTGVYDLNADRCRAWQQRFGARVFPSLEALLESDVDLVVNLTNPDSHYEVTASCLRAGKHVYTEKPLAKTLEEARKLIELAEEKGLFLAAAPCSLLGDAAQTLWRAIEAQQIGRVHTAYVELSVPTMSEAAAKSWVASHERGGLAAEHAARLDFPVEWPYTDEFRNGPAYEHASYPLKWLTSWFGPAKSLVNYRVARLPTKRGWHFASKKLATIANCSDDLYVSCMTLEDDVQVVLINSTVLSLDVRFSLYGDNGALSIDNQWDFASPVWVNRIGSLMPDHRFVLPHAKVSRFTRGYPAGYQLNMDYARGIAELGQSILKKTRSPHICGLAQEAHIQELTELIARGGNGETTVVSSFQDRPALLSLSQHVTVAVVVDDGEAAEYLDIDYLANSAVCRVSAGEPGDGPLARIRVVTPDRLDALLTDPHVDVVVNYSKLSTRGQHTLACLKAGKSVFSKWPLAPTSAVTAAIRQYANTTGLRVGAAGFAETRADVRAFMASVRRGDLGSVKAVLAKVAAHADPLHLPAKLRGSEALGHVLWIATWILGPVWRAVRLSATSPVSPVSPVEVRVTFASGVLMDVAFVHGDAEFAVTLEGTRGSGTVLASGHCECRHPPDVGCDRVLQEPGGGLEDMCRATVTGRPHSHTMEHAVHVAEAIEIVASCVGRAVPVTVAQPRILSDWL